MKSVSNSISNISDTVAFGLTSVFSKIFNKFNKKKEEDIYE